MQRESQNTKSNTKSAPAVPRYRRVKERITDQLSVGAWKPGTALPSEAQLASRYQVSVGTLRRAIEELVNERVLSRQQGSGTFVATHSRPTTFRFFRLVGLSGEKAFPQVQLHAFRRGKCSAEQARSLRVKTGAPIISITNVVWLGGAPVKIDHLVVPQHLFPDLDQATFVGREGTIYDLYQRRYGINIISAAETVRATLATADVARLLTVEKGHPLLEVTRIAMTYRETPIELRRSQVSTVAHKYISHIGTRNL